MVKIAIIKVATRTPRALSSNSYFKKTKKTIKFIMAPRLISLVMKLSEIESFIILKILDILTSLNSIITVRIVPIIFARKPLNIPIKICFLFNLISNFLFPLSQNKKSYHNLLVLLKRIHYQAPTHLFLRYNLD